MLTETVQENLIVEAGVFRQVFQASDIFSTFQPFLSFYPYINIHIYSEVSTMFLFSCSEHFLYFFNSRTGQLFIQPHQGGNLLQEYRRSSSEWSFETSTRSGYPICHKLIAWSTCFSSPGRNQFLQSLGKLQTDYPVHYSTLCDTPPIIIYSCDFLPCQ